MKSKKYQLNMNQYEINIFYIILRNVTSTPYPCVLDDILLNIKYLERVNKYWRLYGQGHIFIKNSEYICPPPVLENPKQLNIIKSDNDNNIISLILNIKELYIFYRLLFFIGGCPSTSMRERIDTIRWKITNEVPDIYNNLQLQLDISGAYTFY